MRVRAVARALTQARAVRQARVAAAAAGKPVTLHEARGALTDTRPGAEAKLDEAELAAMHAHDACAVRFVQSWLDEHCGADNTFG